MSDITSNILQSLETTERISLILLTKERGIISEIIERTKNNDRIAHIYLSKTLVDDFSNHEKVSTASRDDKRKNVMLLDFEGTNKIMGTATFADQIEWDSKYRPHVNKILMYRYPGEDRINGYWKYQGEICEGLHFLSLSTWGKICQGIPRFSASGNYRSAKGSMEHSIALLEFARYIISCVLTEAGIPKHLLDQFLEHMGKRENIAELVRSFTHKSVSPDINYEQAEYRGDRIYISCFSEIMVQKFQNRLTVGEASSYALAYASARYQNIISRDQNLFDKMIKFEQLQSTVKGLTDIFESFIGYIAYVSNDFMPNFQYNVCHSLIAIIVDSHPFDRNLIRGKNKQQVLQILEMNGYPHEITMDIYNNQISFNVSANLLSFFKENQVKGKVKLTGIKEIQEKYDPYAKSKDDASDDVWGIVLKMLQENEISFAKSHNKGMESFFKRIKKYHTDIYEKFETKIKSEYRSIDNVISRIRFNSDFYEGYISMYISTIDPEEEGVYVKGVTFPLKENELEANTYVKGNFIVETKNLATVKYPKEVEKDFKDETPYDYGRYLCILDFINN